ncbi:hypothetical protein D9757_013487 [Collybiopsis confluens]|uniref:Transposase n=1 Tax=Collybiopsis confluens TaxID=2823264 RepID=A0A8H5CSX9_9AGAR|nr:hypothetical protein D9757_013487 [Collybiopsis confluens]
MTRNTTANKQKCPTCECHFAPNVFSRHMSSCQRKADEQKSAKEFQQQQSGQSDTERSWDTGINTSTYPNEPMTLSEDAEYPIFFDFHENGDRLEEYDHVHAPEMNHLEHEPEPDDIKIEYHPSSGRPVKHMPFHEYGKQKDLCGIPVPSDLAPWKPWRSRIDFEVAKLALESSMSEDQINTLITILNCVSQGHDNFTLKDNKEIQKMWDLTAERSAKFQKAEIPVSFRNQEPETFELYHRPVWDWLQELVSDKALVSQMEWDAQQMYKYDHTTRTWKRFVEEAWSATSWWKIQNRLPPGAVPLCIVFYADKSKLSSFGTAKGYPVVLRCANLPMDIRNGNGKGGGRVVGWLPIVTDDAARSGKSDFADFKTIVWHESVRKIFESMVQHSKTGYTMVCGDHNRRSLYPCVLIGSSDFEEQCVICLTRGVQSLYPCVKCEIPHDALTDFDSEYPRRTAKDTVDIVNKALKLAQTSKGESEAVLKQHSLRPHINSFFRINNTDPHEAVSFDDLHFLDSGLWEDHILETHKWHIKNVGRDAAVIIDKRFQTFPRWPKLYHFESGISKLTFNDGSKNHDMSKIFLFAAHDVIRKDKDKAGYALLKATRHYINMIMYAGLNVHTSDTIAAGRASTKTFADTLNRYRTYPTGLDKNWNLVKLHYLRHCWDDIESKGVLRGMSTKPNEKFHGPLRKIYLRRTNFKDTAKQIVRIEHQSLVASQIQDAIDLIDASVRLNKPDEQDTFESPLNNTHISLGSKLMPPVSFAHLESTTPLLFSRLHIRVSDFLSDLLPLSHIPLPQGERIKFTANAVLVPYQSLKVSYESLETWRLTTDILRCNPSFHKRPRYDFMIFQSERGPVFAQLRYLFVCEVADRPYPIALIQAYRVLRSQSSHDKDLGLLRILREQHTELISIESIIRGAVAVPASESDPQKLDDMLVWDVLDGDMFLRIKRDFSGYTSGR